MANAIGALGQGRTLGRIATDDLDGVAALKRRLYDGRQVPNAKIDMAISDVSGRDEPTAVCLTNRAIVLSTPNPRGSIVTCIPANRISETRMRAPGAIEVEYRREAPDHTALIVLDFRYFGEHDGSTAQIEELARAFRN